MSANISGLIVGLGNPGEHYERTRHNLGFLFVKTLLGDSWICPLPEWIGPILPVKHVRNHYVLHSLVLAGAGTWLALRPLTYMNLSGQAVSEVAHYYRVGLDNPGCIVVVHDELDLPLGRMKFKQGGGIAGHKGVKSIVQHLGTRDILRLRLGIGKPEHGETTDWVLDRFSSSELATVKVLLPAALEGLHLLVTRGLVTATQHVNSFFGIPETVPTGVNIVSQR
ncbi:Peptidyl-tRNA hydrolase [Desulfovibrionales bacterium]